MCEQSNRSKELFTSTYPGSRSGVFRALQRRGNAFTALSAEHLRLRLEHGQGSAAALTKPKLPVPCFAFPQPIPAIANDL